MYVDFHCESIFKYDVRNIWITCTWDFGLFLVQWLSSIVVPICFLAYSKPMQEYCFATVCHFFFREWILLWPCVSFLWTKKTPFGNHISLIFLWQNNLKCPLSKKLLLPVWKAFQCIEESVTFSFLAYLFLFWILYYANGKWGSHRWFH